jgi:single-strand DNA-binding protein
MSSNSITVVGNLTRSPELRFTTSGRGVASFGLAINRRYQKDGEWVEQVTFVNVVCWGDLGENVAASLDKGARAIITGRLETRSWETQDGEKRSVTEIVADEAGPSLRWATAMIERTERDKPVNENRGGSSGGGGGPSEPLWSDEEPF